MTLAIPGNGKWAMGSLRVFGGILLGIAAGTLVLAVTGAALIFTLFCAPPPGRLGSALRPGR
jgi:hypothetical protein